MSIHLFIVFIMAVLLPQPCLAKRSGEDSLHLLDPSRGLYAALPDAAWTVERDLGSEIATLSRGNAGVIRIRETQRDVQRIRSHQMKRIASGHPGAEVVDRFTTRIGTVEVPVTAFSVPGENIRGTLAYLSGEGFSLEFLCADRGRDFTRTFLACRKVMQSVRIMPVPHQASGEKPDRISSAVLGELPSPEELLRWHQESSRSPPDGKALIDLIWMRGLFALLDGRAGCKGVLSEVQRGLTLARDQDDRTAVKQLDLLAQVLVEPRPQRMQELASHGTDLHAFFRAMVLEEEGAKLSAERIYEQLAGNHVGFFARLALARLACEKGDVALARRRLRGVEHAAHHAGFASHQLQSLEIWKAALQGDRKFLEQALARPRETRCGPSGALALYHLGRVLPEASAERAAQLFQEAIAHDRSFVAAYLAYADALLRGGEAPAFVSSQLSQLLRQAPETPSVKALQKRFRHFRQGR